MTIFVLKADSICTLVECTSTNFVWAPMVQVCRVKKKFLYIMNVMF